MRYVKHAFLLGSESQYPGVCVLEMVIIPSFPLVVTTALCIWELSPGPWPGTGILIYTLQSVLLDDGRV